MAAGRCQASKPGSQTKASAVNARRRCHVLRNLRSRVCNRHRWTDLCRLPDAYARALDRGVRDRTFGSRNREGRDRDASKGSTGVTKWRAATDAASGNGRLPGQFLSSIRISTGGVSFRTQPFESLAFCFHPNVAVLFQHLPRHVAGHAVDDRLRCIRL
jgi:hypothetical protein